MSQVYRSRTGQVVIPAGLLEKPVREFVTWAQTADSDERWELFFKRVGLPTVTTRKFWMENWDALHDKNHPGHQAAWEKFQSEEQRLFNASNEVFQGILASGHSQQMFAVEPACGPGQFTIPWMKDMLSHGGEYFAFDKAPWAVEYTHNRMKQHGLGHEQKRVTLASITDLRRLMETSYGRPKGRVVIILMRFLLHVTMEPVYREFMDVIKKYADDVIIGETSPDLQPDREIKKGTALRTAETKAADLGMTEVKKNRRMVRHHGDKIMISHFTRHSF